MNDRQIINEIARLRAKEKTELKRTIRFCKWAIKRIMIKKGDKQYKEFINKHNLTKVYPMDTK